MQPLLGRHGSGLGLPGGQACSSVKSQLAHSPLRSAQRDASYSRSLTAGRRRDAWKRRPRKGCLVCERHSADTQLSLRPVAAIRDRSPDPSQVGQPVSSSTSAGVSDPASSVQCRTGLPTQGDMVVSGTGDEFAGLQVAERPDTSRNSDVDYLSVRPGYRCPLCLALAMPEPAQPHCWAKVAHIYRSVAPQLRLRLAQCCWPPSTCSAACCARSAALRRHAWIKRRWGGGSPSPRPRARRSCWRCSRTGRRI